MPRRRGPVGGWAPWRGEPRALQGGAGASAGTSRRGAGGGRRGRGGRGESRGAGGGRGGGGEAPAGGRPGGRGAAGGWDGVKSGFIFPICPGHDKRYMMNGSKLRALG